MKRLKIIWLLLIAAWLNTTPGLAQSPTQPPWYTSGSITETAANCTVAGGNWVSLALAPMAGSAKITLSGTFTATLNFEGSSDGVNFAALDGFPLDTQTGASTATTTGTWGFTASALTHICVRASAYTSGTVEVSIRASTASASSGQGGAGSGCSVSGSNNQVVTDDGASGCVSEANLTFDGSDLAVTGTVTPTGGLVGNASTATALAANPAACAADNFATDIASNGTLTCNTLAYIVSNVTLFDSSQATRTLTFGLSGATDPVLSLADGVFNVSVGTIQQAGTAVSLSGHTHAASDVTSGTLAHERGGLEADVSGYVNGLYGMLTNVTADVDTMAELEQAIGGTNIMDSTEVFDLSTLTNTLVPYSNGTDFSEDADFSWTAGTNTLGVGNVDFIGYTVGTLPTPNTNMVAIVTDGNAAGDCTTGAGSTRVLCSYTGTAWAAIGDGNSGGTPAFSDITTGTNTTAAMTVGTGGSIAVSGTGTVAATSGDAFASFFPAFTSANLAGDVSDETGSGLLVFGTSPTIVTPTIASFANAAHDHTNAAGGGTLTGAAMSDASTTASGDCELATAAETTTGTDTGRCVTPDGLAGSDFGKRLVQMVVIGFATAHTTGDGKFYLHIPAELNGMNLVSVEAQVITTGTTGTLNVDLARCAIVATGNPCSGTVADMLSTNLTIDSGESRSATAAAAAVIDTANDDVATGQVIRVDVDAIHTTPGNGLIFSAAFQVP